MDLDWTVGTGIGSNVLLTVHGHRSAESDSRPRWLNCGISSPNRFYHLPLKISHWGASGVPQVFTDPTAKVTEPVQNGGVRGPT